MGGHDILLGEIAEAEDYVLIGNAEESNDDGIENFAGTNFVDELYTDSDFDEHGVKAALEAQTANKNDFNIDTSEGNFRMKLNEELKDLPMETRLRSKNEDDDNTDSGSDSYSDSKSECEPEPDSEFDASNANATDDHDGGNNGQRDSTGNRDESVDGGDGLEHLRTELEKKYNIDNIDQISYALAAGVNCIERNFLIRSAFQQDVDDGTLSLLADAGPTVSNHAIRA
ncbi:uncharacterized protein FPRO_16043 [Fusarium proliferatum ET1]|uniref:Uncharacterized protein n=1 Tax=Fusarium proliferatum (strain ET1) TaxID=1227346 RepID=A0A1L7WB35_FUSPR|nr:uncharacterized protein FPRO_16043 [Fusarium proliferatum ET1]CZR49835.1 uncharacterized protein FPRO_16043 [Fusarium proliferatum ET1]